MGERITCDVCAEEQHDDNFEYNVCYGCFPDCDGEKEEIIQKLILENAKLKRQLREANTRNDRLCRKAELG